MPFCAIVGLCCDQQLTDLVTKKTNCKNEKNCDQIEKIKTVTSQKKIKL